MKVAFSACIQVEIAYFLGKKEQNVFLPTLYDYVFIQMLQSGDRTFSVFKMHNSWSSFSESFVSPQTFYLES